MLENQTDLAQRALQFSQEVIITQVNGLVVNVINSKLQFLNYFEEVIDDKLFGKPWTEAVLHLFGPSNLLGRMLLKVNRKYGVEKNFNTFDHQKVINFVY